MDPAGNEEVKDDGSKHRESYSKPGTDASATKQRQPHRDDADSELIQSSGDPLNTTLNPQSAQT